MERPPAAKPAMLGAVSGPPRRAAVSFGCPEKITFYRGQILRKDKIQIVAPDASEGSRPARIEQRRRGEENTACRQREEAEKGGKHALNFQFEVDDGRDEDKFSSHRRLFSGAIKRHCGAKSPSSPSSSNSSSSSSYSLKSNRFYELNLLERSNSTDSDIETAVEGAIAHRKKFLQQQNSSTKIESEVVTCLLTASTVASYESTGRSELCRI
ncbi:hypothetical protein Nepgr_026587 [Nepenthes gracilis]|uniref:Uncharacterized protein n=1 Tax=Nepenthes gracilis TaxID=150966 RepID=A0AAD3T8N7_NEPGR|nr:hypothetical protein Nepgr_026587 [Nepenthes gracilis]